MWPPPNIQSLPSKEEIHRAKEEISTIELEIIETELKLDALKKSLSERKAWIAPIRTIPHEILSLIFIDVSTTNWKAPLVLQSVSRRWRDVVVDSSKAWTFIPLSKYSSERRSELISLFLERGRNIPLHASVGNDSLLLGYMEHLADRIECIHLKTTRVLLNCYLQRGHTFHQLERLKICHWDSAEDAPAADAPAADGPAAWDMLLFPNLKVLDIEFPSSSLLRAISAAPEFPRIRHLTVSCRDPWRLQDILIKCATSLESVDLSYDNLTSEGPDMEQEVSFPRLRYMRLADFSNESRRLFRLKAATPNLQEYLDGGIISTLNAVKVDTGNVILLYAVRIPDLSRYPRLVTLGFGTRDAKGEEVMKVIECLRDNPTLCPDLALIECVRELTQGQIVKAKDALLARERVTGHNIQLLEGTINTWEECMHMFRVVEPCGDHMPCRL